MRESRKSSEDSKKTEVNMWNRIKEKITSPVVWLAVIAQVAGLIALFNPEITDTFKAIAISIVEICTLFGILNNPNNKEGF